MQTYLSLAGPAGGEPYIVRHGDCIGDTLYRVTTASERDAQADRRLPGAAAMSGRRQYGESMREKRAQWKAAGRCRDCGAPEDKPGSGICARHRESRNRGNYRRRHVAVTVHLPGPLHHRIREDAESRGETVEAWLLAEARAIFEPEPEGTT